MGAQTGSFKTAFRAEMLKGKRGGARKVALVAPLPFCALGVLSSGVLQGTGAVGGIATSMWNYWMALMLPIAVALICASVANLDGRQKLRPARRRSRRRCGRARGGPRSPARSRSCWARTL